jgi:hypothetical protein
MRDLEALEDKLAMEVENLPFRYRIRLHWHIAMVVFRFYRPASQEYHLKKVEEYLSFATADKKYDISRS